MKLMEDKTKKIREKLITTYKFDKLDSLEDIKEIVNSFKKFGIDVKSVSARELGDYEDAPLNINYDVEEIDKIVEDFSNKNIEVYTISANYNDYDISALIDPEMHTMQVKYQPIVKEEINRMLSELDTNEPQIINTRTIQ